MSERVQKARELQLLMKAIIYLGEKKKNHASIYYFVPISPLTSFPINNSRLDHIAENF